MGSYLQQLRRLAVHTEERLFRTLHTHSWCYLPFIGFQQGLNLHNLLHGAWQFTEDGIPANHIATHHQQIRQVIFLCFLSHRSRLQVVLQSSIQYGRTGCGCQSWRLSFHQFSCRRQPYEVVMTTQKRSVSKWQ